MNTQMTMNQLMAVSNTTEDILGKVVYYSLFNILVPKEEFQHICDAVGFPTENRFRDSAVNAFRSATTDIRQEVTEKIHGAGTVVYKVHFRDNMNDSGERSRELVKEILGKSSNEYKKLANICLSEEGRMYYENIEYDTGVDAENLCMQAIGLYEKYKTCIGRRQIENLIKNYLQSMSASKVVARGNMYFVPKANMHRLHAFEDMVEALARVNQNPNAGPAVQDVGLYANSMYVVNDQKQRTKMAAAFYETILPELEHCSERISYFIAQDCQSRAVMQRWVQRVRELEDKKQLYENTLKMELDQFDQKYEDLKDQAVELQFKIRDSSIKAAA